MKKMIVAVSTVNNKLMSISITNADEMMTMIHDLESWMDKDEEELHKLLDTRDMKALCKSLNTFYPQLLEEAKDEMPSDLYRKMKRIKTTYTVVSKKKIKSLIEFLKSS